MRTLLLLFIIWTGTAQAQELTIIQPQDGSSGGSFNHFDNGLSTYNGQHGESGYIQDLGGGVQHYSFQTPNGREQSGTIYNYGSTPSQRTLPMPAMPSYQPTMPPQPQQQVQPYGWRR